MKDFLRISGLHTVCEESLCPNISECFRDGVATFMILGNVCTRNCKFCAVAQKKLSGSSFLNSSSIFSFPHLRLKMAPKSNPKLTAYRNLNQAGMVDGIDWDEPHRIANAVISLDLRYIVITSPTRDDLSDGGAEVFFRTVEEIKSKDNLKKVEILIPDFLGNMNSLTKVANSKADVVSHNLETVPSLYARIRPKASYKRSLSVLERIKQLNEGIFTKSGIMLGLGEKEKEVLRVLGDLRKVKCDFLTLGQYLAPSLQHYPVKEYIAPERFAYFEKIAYRLGFKKAKSSPYVRSSYLAEEFFKEV